ncbi:MAG: phosphodiester glycosidase family protein [Myxococcaceae bacterium]|nr:phosphodiester glycosidase family protein [Myxococcaceae bacterium]
MNRLLVFLGLLAVVPEAFATDVWDDPFPGVRHLHRTGASNLNIHAAVVDLCAPGVSVRTTAYAERAQRTSAFATAVGAQLAINADFSCRPVDVAPGSPFPPCLGHVAYVTYGMAMHDGVTWPGTLGLDALLAFGVDRAQMYDNADKQPFESWMREGTSGHFSNVINGAANGYDCPIDPRTAMGLSKDRTKLILVVADGRNTYRGITCREAADLMVELGADRGTGLDSGGSSTMWFAGQGVLNHPSDGTERVVGNHLAIYAPGVGSPSHCAPPPTTINASAALPAVAPFGAPGRFNSIVPVRLFDTRSAGSSANLLTLARDADQRVSAGSTFSVEIAGAFGVPANATAVAANLTATDALAGGFATVWPAGLAKPVASSLNYGVGGAVTNTSLTGLGTQGRISVSPSTPAHFVADLQGYFAPTGAGFVPVAPRRLLDTRSDPGGILKAATPRTIVPAATPQPLAYALNLAVTGSTAGGFVTVYPCGQSVPTSSSINFAAGQTVSAAVLASTGPTGICAQANVDVHLIVDRNGTFEATGGLDFQALAPVRLVDTRDAASPWVGRTTRQTPLPLKLDALAGLPAQTKAVALNVTVTGGVDDGFATIYPCSGGWPGTSNINYRAGQTIANSALVGLGTDGKVCLYSSGRTHVVIDLTGVFFGALPAQPDAGVVQPDASILDPDAGSEPLDAGAGEVPDASIPGGSGGGTGSSGGSGGGTGASGGGKPIDWPSENPAGGGPCGCSGGALGTLSALAALAWLARRRRAARS